MLLEMDYSYLILGGVFLLCSLVIGLIARLNRNPTRKLSKEHNYHGGCGGCSLYEKNAVKTCKKCQYWKPDWSLPDLNDCYGNIGIHTESTQQNNALHVEGGSSLVLDYSSVTPWAVSSCTAYTPHIVEHLPMPPEVQPPKEEVVGNKPPEPKKMPILIFAGDRYVDL